MSKWSWLQAFTGAAVALAIGATFSVMIWQLSLTDRARAQAEANAKFSPCPKSAPAVSSK